MSHVRYIGSDPLLTGHSALARPAERDGYILVQVDKFDHPWSHGWHESPAADWEEYLR